MAMPPVTPTSTVRSPAGAVGVWPLTLRSVRGLVLDLVVDDLLEGDGEEVGAARVDERRRQLLDAHRVLAEAVVVAVDLPRALRRRSRPRGRTHRPPRPPSGRCSGGGQWPRPTRCPGLVAGG